MWFGGVRVIAVDEENRVLMVKQHHEDRDIWMLPGGGIEEGENAREAAAREVLEETGLSVEVGPMLWHVEEVSETRGQRFVNFFFARAAGGEPELGRDPEFDAAHQVLREVRFLSAEAIAALPHVYPEFLRTELPAVLENSAQGGMYDAFRVRERRPEQA
ncbi:NUDIX domain-containing protein [Bacilliculturomica massiliensis]|uniref:NUDIX domain-containing protein n=1 Tax=Bacilliculturomica massiliensis TaxID=1917867 RepID=UPI0010309F95|nr:NUDIX hydrolase [Bacilliculturomica massiliensis]